MIIYKYYCNKRQKKKTTYFVLVVWGWSVPEAASSSSYSLTKQKIQTIRYCASDYYGYLGVEASSFPVNRKSKFTCLVIIGLDEASRLEKLIRVILLTIHCAIIYNKHLYRNINKNKYYFSLRRGDYFAETKMQICGFFLLCVTFKTYSLGKGRKVIWERNF